MADEVCTVQCTQKCMESIANSVHLIHMTYELMITSFRCRHRSLPSRSLPSSLLRMPQCNAQVANPNHHRCVRRACLCVCAWLVRMEIIFDSHSMVLRATRNGRICATWGEVEVEERFVGRNFFFSIIISFYCPLHIEPKIHTHICSAIFWDEMNCIERNELYDAHVDDALQQHEIYSHNPHVSQMCVWCSSVRRHTTTTTTTTTTTIGVTTKERRTEYDFFFQSISHRSSCT